MKRWVMNGTFALVLVTVLAVSIAGAFANENQPDMFVAQMRHDFGNVFEQDQFEYDFVVQNRGKADLVIESVKPG